MRRILSAATVVAACAPLAAVPSVAAAKRRAPEAWAVRVGVRVSRGPWSATLKPAGRLPNDPLPWGGGLVNDAVASGGGPVIGGDTLAIIGFKSHQNDTPELLLYTKAAGGWTAAKAPGVYPFPVADSAFSIAVGSGVVAASGFGGSTSTSGMCGDPVFTPGPGGFARTLAPAACLDLPPGGGPAIVGANTIVAESTAYVAESPSSVLEVFAEPAGGWAGTVAPEAQLHTSDGAELTSISMSGTTIAALGFNTSILYIFTEPVGGWSGVIHETARIPLPGVGSATLSGKTLVALGTGNPSPLDPVAVRAPVFVLRRPVGGWQALRSPQPRAFVLASNPNLNFGLQSASLLGRTTAFTNVTTCGDEGYPPCQSTIWAINGLSSSVGAPKQLPVNASRVRIEDADGTPVAGDGTTLALGADGVRLYSIAHTTPARVTRATLTGLIGPKPNPALRLTIVAGKGAAALTSLRALVPAGLGGNGRSRTIALKPSKRTAIVTLRQLRPNPALLGTVSRIGRHGGRTTLTVPVELIDTAAHSSESQVKVTITR